MSQLSPSLRKAAVLISALDERAAEALLQQMSSDDAAKVRSALVELDNVPAAEQRQVLADFLQAQSGGRQPADSSGGVDLELTSAVEDAAEPVEPAKHPPVAIPAFNEPPSFDF